MRESPSRPDEPAAAASTEPAKTRRGGWAPRPLPKAAATVEPGCTPEEETLCIRGDAWWLDSCGTPHAKAEDCGVSRCEEGACIGLDPACADMGAGRCEGEVAVGCAAGQPYRRDCAETGRVCVQTEEGAACRQPVGQRCLPGTPPRCDGDELVSCADGQEQRLACDSVGAQCLTTRGGRVDACIRPGAAPTRPGCAACGCELDPSTPERCNGLDDDGDGFVDEDAECEVVDLLALVVADGDGNTDYTDADFEEELVRINRYFEREDDLGLSFRWADVVYLDAEQWLQIDDGELQRVLTSGGHLRKLDRFYVPVLFTRELLVDDVPRPGVATPPNGTCGGVRRVQGRQPLVGGVVIAKQRWESTVAHEIGHYLGLCHTHAPSVDAVVEVDADGTPCADDCTVEGDGICDTPTDPGPAGCAVSAACEAVCSDDETPDVSNVMGYYPTCRAGFSAEQAAEVRRGLDLRRGWYGCVFEPCSCTPAGGECPEGMTCSPYDEADGGTRWQCRLDGPTPPGGPCEQADDCADGLCVRGADGASTCTRLCDARTPACVCGRIPGIDVALCTDDLEG